METTIDCRGLACPLPVVHTKKAAEALHPGDALTVLVDNAIAVQNLQRFAAHRGCAVAARKDSDTEFAVTLHIPGTAAPAPEQAPACAPDRRSRGLTVVLSGSTMGTGDDKLGTALMKAFVFALTQQDRLPETILCYNSGAFLTCRGADTLADLQALEAAGVTVLTCGTCLDFYGLKDALAVGGVTNMYDIVERMASAGTLLRP